MRVLVAGAGGVVGSRLVPQLLARGHHVVGTTRTRARLDSIRSLGATPLVMDGLDTASVLEAAGRAAPDAIVHQMTALAGVSGLKHFDDAFAATNELRTTGTDNLVAAAKAVGVTRVVAQSYTGWPNARDGGRVKDEDDPLDPSPPAAQERSLAAIRHLEAAVDDDPRLDGVVLRYGALYGRGASDPIVGLVCRRRLPLVGSAAGVWSFVHVDDAAAATVAAIEGGPPGIYNVVDDEPTPVSEWLPYLAECVGAKRPRHVPVWLARLLVGEPGISLMTEIRGASNAKARRELGWEPRWTSWRDGFRHGLLEQSAPPVSAMAGSGEPRRRRAPEPSA